MTSLKVSSHLRKRAARADQPDGHHRTSRWRIARRHRSVRVLGGAVVAAALALSAVQASPAHADLDELRREREKSGDVLEAQKFEEARMTGDLERQRAALEDMAGQIEQARNELAHAETVQADLDEKQVKAERDQRNSEVAVAKSRATVVQAANTAFVDPRQMSGADTYEQFHETRNGAINDLMDKDVMRSFVNGDIADGVDRYRSAQEDLERSVKALERARNDADDAAEEKRARIQQLEALNASMEQSIVSLEEDLERLAYEASIQEGTLATLDSEIAAEIAKRQTLIEMAKKAAAEKAKAEADAAAAAKAASAATTTTAAPSASSAVPKGTAAQSTAKPAGETKTAAVPKSALVATTAPPAATSKPRATAAPASAPVPAPTPSPAATPSGTSSQLVPPPPPGVDIPTLSIRESDMVVVEGRFKGTPSAAAEMRRLLADARAQGVNLSLASAYRSTQSQVDTRFRNCPFSDVLSIYTARSSACSPPTAPPGKSQHEHGNAFDIAYNGSTICFPNGPSRCIGNPGFEWLKANAARYGFKNLESEPWHWSTTGR